MDTKRTIVDLFEAKRQRQKIVVLSCYAYLTAGMAIEAGIDVLLVGDSAAQVLLGHDTTLPATMDLMVHLKMHENIRSQETEVRRQIKPMSPHRLFAYTLATIKDSGFLFWLLSTDS